MGTIYRWGAALGALYAVLLGVLGGCELLIGYEPATLYQPDGGAGGASGTTGAGGQGGGPTCEAGKKEACYSGPAGTEGKGICKAGSHTCEADGDGWGDCTGEQRPLAESCEKTADENCDGYDCALWAKLYGDENAQVAYALASDSTGNVYIGGSFTGTIQFGQSSLISGGTGNAFVAKFDGDGGLLWAKQFGNTGVELVSALAVDTNGNVVMAGYSGEVINFGGPKNVPAGIFVAKLDSSGKHLWSNGFPVGGVPGFGITFGPHIAVDQQGNVVVAGSYGGSIDLGGGPQPCAGGYDIFVAKLRGSDGSATAPGFWGRRFGDAAIQYGKSVAVDTAGNVFLTGTFRGTLSMDGSDLVSAGAYDMFIAKLTPSGSLSWSARFGDADDQGGEAIAVDKAGGPIVTGGFAGSLDFPSGKLTAADSDIFIVKFSSVGTEQWARRYGAADSEIAYGMAVDGTGGIHIAGIFYGTFDLGGKKLAAPPNGSAVFVAKLDAQGNHVWSRGYGGVGVDQLLLGVAVTPAGETLLGGSTSFFLASPPMPIDLGAGTFTTAGMGDGFYR